MADDNNIKNYSAADIEKYHKGLLSSKEMHELEKAALDDPFLADALEGYATAGVNAAADIDELKERLSEKTEGAKVIAMPVKRQMAFVWWRIAAVIILIAGVGLLIYQFAFNKSSEPIAQNKSENQKGILLKDSEQAATPLNRETSEKPVALQNKKTDQKEKSGKVTVTNETVGMGASKIKSDTALVAINQNNKLVTLAPPKGSISTETEKKEEKEKSSVASTEINAKLFNEQSKQDEAGLVKTMSDKNADGVKDQFAENRSAAFSKTNQSLGYNLHNGSLHNNVFRGRVTDDNNNPLPFANITNTADSVGTYADAKGYFTLTSPDSVLNVRIQSLGFTNSIIQLRNNVPNSKVTLHEDKSLNAVVLSNKKPNARRFGESNMKLEQPEPADGWDNYDTYLANNLNVPETIRMKETGGNVELSFEVDKNGEPINIKVEKSLCSECDKEAIRLIKEGPKWKRKAKKDKATVRISF